MKGILRTLALTGIIAAAGAAAAQAQVAFAVRVGPPAPPVVYSNYVPPCPGVDYVWTPGYYAGAVWVPGQWMHHEHYVVRDYGYGPRYDRGYHVDYRGWDHGRR
ncbi:YXWGXW repeat-containing protein [Silvibacterium dinghuense]|uniref:Uncharacterized protein n=1 Tax=Silvibacterium dinghuense TaxID=1560006 RepID=A0A4Q1SI57_9BACT|nr:YXWGXW repeat-containing protein [Silvibacterium dinghuense]RXS97266.1 hypothetical protein ESZ00_04970 [Silvibacterium dinghuense]GGG97621.1 hypothetical protein GCM10011586_11120 [Silvibacterium dinghuense]